MHQKKMICPKQHHKSNLVAYTYTMLRRSPRFTQLHPFDTIDAIDERNAEIINLFKKAWLIDDAIGLLELSHTEVELKTHIAYHSLLRESEYIQRIGKMKRKHLFIDFPNHKKEIMTRFYEDYKRLFKPDN